MSLTRRTTSRVINFTGNVFFRLVWPPTCCVERLIQYVLRGSDIASQKALLHQRDINTELRWCIVSSEEWRVINGGSTGHSYDHFPVCEIRTPSVDECETASDNTHNYNAR